MFGSYKTAVYTALLSCVDGKILLIPVRVRHVKNARTWLPTLFTHLRRTTFKHITVINFTFMFHISFTSAAVKSVFSTLTFSIYRPVAKKPEVDIMMPSLVSEAHVFR